MRSLLIYAVMMFTVVATASPGGAFSGPLSAQRCGLVMVHTPAFIQVRDGIRDWWQSAEAREYGWTERWWATAAEPAKPIRDPLRPIVAQSPKAIYVHLDIPGGTKDNFEVSIFREGQKDPVRTEGISYEEGEYKNSSLQPRPPPMSRIYQFEVSATMYLSAYGGSVPVEIATLAESISMFLPRYRSTWAMAFQHVKQALPMRGLRDIPRGIYRFFDASPGLVGKEREGASLAPLELFMQMRGLKAESIQNSRSQGYSVGEEGSYALFGTPELKARSKNAMMIDARIYFFEKLLQRTPKWMIFAHVASAAHQRLYADWGLKPVEAFLFFDKNKMTWKPGDAPMGRPMTLKELEAWDKKKKTEDDKNILVERILAVDLNTYVNNLRRLQIQP